MRSILCVLVVIVLTASSVSATVKLPKIFSDNMVLQRGRPIVIWGWADPGERIRIKLNRQDKVFFAEKDGKWKVILLPERCGGPYELLISGKNIIQLKDVMIGDVWVTAGQSNMLFAVRKSLNADIEMASANYPAIRQFKMDNAESIQPLDDYKNAKWKVCTPKTAGDFTAVGYFFAREIYKDLNVPIGIINISRGGTNIESWISVDAFERSSEFNELLASMENIITDSLLSPLGKPKINNYPGLLFNGMINPIVTLPIKGVLWYQGEANIGRAYEYRKAFTLLINDWRERWGQGDFPFYFAQLSSYKGNNGTSNSGSMWAELRESQTEALSLPNTGMAVTIDIGEPDDIHPRNKQDVGKRLAAIALHNAYGKQVAWNGPQFKLMTVANDKVRISFNYVEGGLKVKNEMVLAGFEIAGSDGHFFPAEATISGNEVIVKSEYVKIPAAVRYAWADNCIHANLYNAEGFPAAPFRTDEWRGVTVRAKYLVKQQMN
jgi:sialate O-acetylesterase